MKNFATYLAESEKTFDFRIKLVGDLPKEFVSAFKEQLKKFDPVSIGELKTTPILARPTNFPDFSNQAVNIIDASFRYPANLQQVQQIVRLLGIPENRVCMDDLNWAEGMDKELLGIENNKDLLTSDYPAPDAEQKKLKKDYAAAAADKEVVKNSASEAKFTVAGGKTPPAKTTNDLPQGVRSPMTNIKRPPKPATGFQR